MFKYLGVVLNSTVKNRNSLLTTENILKNQLRVNKLQTNITL